MATYNIPLKIINLQDDGFHLLVEIVVFGEVAFAVLDTGASRSVFDKRLMENHNKNLTENSETQANTIFSTATTLLGEIPILKIGALNIKNYQAVVIDLQAVNDTYLQMGHPTIGGIIGGDILMAYSAKIDYKKQILRLYK
jgi:hypothetical protein